MVVLTLPVVCWLGVQECPARALLAWAVPHKTALLAVPKAAARASENFDISCLPEYALNEMNRIQTTQTLNEAVKTRIPSFITKER
jgi:alcohol dehydrogenase (NADP+)